MNCYMDKCVMLLSNKLQLVQYSLKILLFLGSVMSTYCINQHNNVILTYWRKNCQTCQQHQDWKPWVTNFETKHCCVGLKRRKDNSVGISTIVCLNQEPRDGFHKWKGIILKDRLLRLHLKVSCAREISLVLIFTS